MVGSSRKWGGHYHRLEARIGSKKAIVANAPSVGYGLRAAQDGLEVLAGPGESTAGILPEQIPSDINPSDPACLRGQPRQASSLGAGVCYNGPLTVAGKAN